jgi:hypothetical protein
MALLGARGLRETITFSRRRIPSLIPPPKELHHKKLLILFQHKMLTAIHKHYPIEVWKEFAENHPEVLPVSIFT